LALPATIKLKRTLGQLAIGQDVSITGPTSGSLSIKGKGSRVFEITAGVANISDLTIEKGTARNANGGGVLVDYGASLTLNNCTLSKNKATGKKRMGGGIFNSGTVTLTNCTLDRNRSRWGGGAICNYATAILTNCTLTKNRSADGGAILNQGGESAGIATLTNCTLSRNRARGGGGGIYNAGTATLTNSTLDRNKARVGGGIFAVGLPNITGGVTLTNCTLKDNKSGLGDGIANGYWFTLTNTIVAGSRGSHKNCQDPVNSNGHNLSSDAYCFTTGGTDLLNTNPELAPLANYGGPTDTLALCSGVGVPDPSCKGASPAIDAGDDAVTGPPLNLTTDQRGLPRQTGAHVDIGAYEGQ
jgi:predicted outer membrane repeat protein